MKMIFKLISLLIISFLACSCAGRLSFEKGESALRQKDWDSAVQYFLRAVQNEPDNPRYRLYLAKSMIEASNFHLLKGKDHLEKGELKIALIEFEKALEFNPENADARRMKRLTLKKMEEEKRKAQEKTEIEKAKEEAKKKKEEIPSLPTMVTPINLRFTNADLKEVFKALQKVSCINFLYDESFQSKKISIDISNLSFKDAFERLLLQAKLFYKIIDPQTIIIIPDNPAKRRQYEEVVMKTFFLSNADPNQIQTLLRSLAEIKTVAINPSLNCITVRDTPKKVELAEQIIKIHDKSKGELLIDVEILEVNRSRMREYGIELSQYQILETLSPGLPTEGSAVRGHMFEYINASDFLFSIPSISYKLLQADTKSKIIAKPQLRVLDQETVSVRLGDKVPIPVTTFVPIAGGGPSQQPITSFQMQDIGINIDLTPQMHHDGWITLKLKFELTFITNPGTATLPPTIGNRSVTTIIRLKDNETGLLAGLLRDTERKSLRGFPGVIELPVLSRIFSGTSEEITQTDIILTLTPRIIKFPEIEEEDLKSIWVGTEEDLGLKAPPPPSPFKEEKVEERLEREEKPKEEKKAKEEKEKERKETEEPIGGKILILPDFQIIEKGKEFSAKLLIEGIMDLKTLDLELEFDPKIVKVKEMQEGSILKSEGVKGHLLKNFDNENGKIQIGLTLDRYKEGESAEIVIIRFQSLSAGKISIDSKKYKIFNSKMQEIKAEFAKANIEIKGN